MGHIYLLGDPMQIARSSCMPVTQRHQHAHPLVAPSGPLLTLLSACWGGCQLCQGISCGSLVDACCAIISGVGTRRVLVASVLSRVVRC
jgi:hypothetical protein